MARHGSDPVASDLRTHSDAQVVLIAAGNREVGWTNPILVDGENTGKLGMDTWRFRFRTAVASRLPCPRRRTGQEMQWRRSLIG